MHIFNEATTSDSASSSAPLKTLILGGYGNFGARIARALAPDPTIALLLGGRDSVKATALAQALGHGTQGVTIDHTAPNLAEQLRNLGIGLLIHTAGPFQQQAYGVAHAAAAAGAHYIDLADGRRFVCDFPAALDEAFRGAGKTGISGASTVPALSSAVVDHLCAGWQAIDSIDTCIAPAQTAPRGKATLAAVLSYCGAPIAVWQQGRWQNEDGWAKPERVEFARLKPRRGALCDIPDLELFPAHYGVRQRVSFKAALEVGLAQQSFALLAYLRRLGLLTRPDRLAGFLNAAAPAMDWLGSPLGGMVLRVHGVNASGQMVRRAWHIAAGQDHGPEIPCMATILLAQKLARGASLPIGAMACTGLLALEEFAPLFAQWGMVTDVVEEEVGHGTPTL